MFVLVLAGGCPGGAFTAGALSGLQRAGVLATHFTAMVTTSSGGWNAVYYRTLQLLQEGLRLWHTHLPNGFLRWHYGRPYADMTYLENLARHREPLNVSLLKQPGPDIFVTTTDLRARSTLYIHLNSATDPIRSLVTASAMSILSNPFLVQGRLLSDGALTDPIPLHYASDVLGAKKIWVILNKPKGFRNRRLPWKLAARFASTPEERELLVDSLEQENAILREIESAANLIVIRPADLFPAAFLTYNGKYMSRLIAAGEEAALCTLRSL